MNNYNHEFKIIPFEDYKFYNDHNIYQHCRICIKCKILIAKTSNKSMYDYFFINGIEIYRDVPDFNCLNMSCEEILIKNILE